MPFWLALLGGYQIYAYRSGLSPLEALDHSMFFLYAGLLEPLVYVALFMARPLVLFPTSVLAVLAGFVFGPVLGSVLALVGGNASASFAYLSGRYFGKEDVYRGRPEGMVRRFAERARANGFVAVLTVQLAYLPFDLVNYLAGFLRTGRKPFALATLLGSLPGTVSFALLGSSFEMDFTSPHGEAHPPGARRLDGHLRQHYYVEVRQAT